MKDKRGDALSSSDIARARDVFGLVCDLNAAERESVLNRECGDSPVLLAAVRELLIVHDGEHGVLDVGDGGLGRQLFEAVDAADERVMCGTSIGPYKIRSVIGQGGMGIVYLAEQSNPHREVALKIVQRGRHSAALRSRFEREIRVLGRLKHPGITHIYEAGSAETRGGPVAFFAMEYVNGKPLTEAVSELGLTLAERVEVVAKIADAVQHAHTKGVIHRDLKPANILVVDAREATGTSEGTTRSRVGGPQPKILDFGVARVLEPDSVHTQVTEAGHVIGTISYMSPEQLGGDVDSVDARTDVYALGVILYELITGRLPHDLRGKQIAEAARIVRDDPASAMQGPGEPRRDRDLETIVLHAMDKDREKRYATAAAFAEDLRRYLRNETILAKPATALDQFVKFARRNKGLVVGLSAAALAVTSGLVISTGLYFKEQKARQRADAKERLNAAFKEYMIDGVLLAAKPDRKGWDVKVMDVLVDAAEQIKGKFPDDPDIEASLRSDLGDVLAELGKWKECKAERLAALPLIESVYGSESVQTIRILNQIASAHQMLSENEDWLRVGQESLRRAERMLLVEHFDRISAMTSVGGALITRGKIQEGEEILRRALVPAAKNPKAYRNPLGSIYNWLAVCAAQSGDVEGVVRMHRANYDFMCSVVGPDNFDTQVIRMNLVVALVNAKKHEEAISTVRGLPEAIEQLVPPEHPIRSHVYAVAGTTLGVPGHFEEAEKYLLRSYELQNASAKDFDWFTEVRIKLLRQLYKQWPGHVEQVKYWSAQSVKARLLLATAAEIGNLPDILSVAVRSCGEAGLEISRVEMMEYIWSLRDEFAPAGHGRRSAFYANFVRMSVLENFTQYASEAMKLARESALSDAEKGRGNELVQAAEEMLNSGAGTPATK